LSRAKFKTFAQVNSHAPRTLDANRVERICIKRLRHIFSEKELRFTKDHEATKNSPTEGAHFHHTGKHVARKSRAGRIRTAEIGGIGTANIGIDLIVRTGKVKLCVSPECIVRKEHTLLSDRLSGFFRLSENTQKNTQHDPEQPFHDASEQSWDTKFF